jgi:hypothetical protein
LGVPATKFHGLTPKEIALLRRLRTPQKIQAFLDAMPINFEKNGDTIMSVRRSLRENKSLCIEGALIAAAALWVNGQKPLILDLRCGDKREDHVVALYRQGGRWGAISKTNHVTLRFRDPIYLSVRELAASYFHEFFMNDTRRKSLEDYAAVDLRQFGGRWLTDEENMEWLVDAINEARHHRLFPKKSRRHIRKADDMEMRAAQIVEWLESDPRT